LFDRAVTWLRRERVLLPGESLLARLVSEIRSAMSDRMYATLAGCVDTEIGRRLDALLTVPEGTRLLRAGTAVSRTDARIRPGDGQYPRSGR